MTTTHAPTRRPAGQIVGALVVVILAVLAVLASGWYGRHEVTTVSDPVAVAAAAVDWTHYQPGYRERLAEDGCPELAEAYAAAQLVDGPVDSRPVAAYIAQLQAARNCPA